MIELNGRFDNISQRAACSYIRTMAELAVTGMDAAMADSARELHAFFQAIYQRVFDFPAEFGLPTTPDDCITGEEQNGTEKKAEMNRKLNRPREMIQAGLDFLLLVGQQGLLVEDRCSLALDPDAYAQFIGNSRGKKQFFKGLPGAGLEIREGEQQVVVESAQFPRMFPALKALAKAAAQCPDANLGRYNFGRCDFRALDPNFKPSALDLYRVFNEADYQRVARLDVYFTARGYKPIFKIYGNFGFEVEYQGKRSIKSSPLLRVEFSERFLHPLRVTIKCASTDRLLPLLSRQPRSLQEDFSRRVFNCNGDACGWCKTRPHLGPSVYEFDGVTRTICWFSNGDAAQLDDETEQLIQQYAELHEALG